jgi:hypothetical protein
MMADQSISKPKIQEQNQKYATATTQKPYSIRDITVFRRTRHDGKVPARLPADSHQKFSKIRIEGGGEYWTCGQAARSQELELETQAAS